MPVASSWFGGPKRLLWSFALVLLLPAVAVGWLGLRLIDQDRELESRQRLERRDIAGERVVAGLERAVAATERQLRDPRSGIGIQPGADAVLVTMRPTDWMLRQRRACCSLPIRLRPHAEPTTEFTDGEALEFNGAHARASSATGCWRTRRTRPSAPAHWSASAGTLRKSGRPIEALAVYEDCPGSLGRTLLDCRPIWWADERAQHSLQNWIGTTNCVRAHVTLQADLVARRWALDRGTFVSYAGQVREWTGEEPPAMAEREALSDAVDWLWQEWRRGALTSAGRVVRRHGSSDVTVLWQPGADGPGTGRASRGARRRSTIPAREWVPHSRRLASLTWPS